MVYKISVIALFMVFSTASFSQLKLCDRGLTKEVKLHANGKVKSEGYYKNGIKIGKWAHYYDTGSKESTAYYDSKGDRSGKWTSWYKNGQKWNTVCFNKGAAKGHWTYWYQNGNKWHKLSYADGEVHGKWTFWLEDGKLNDTGRYKDMARKG